MKNNTNDNITEKTREIRALYDETTIRVYQAYNDKIADEAIMLGTFGQSFKMERMTWIKPSFLWMMYRSGWATKDGQERILAIDIKREGFNKIVEGAVISSFGESDYTSYEEWQDKIKTSEVRCQWDPDRDIFGNPLNRRAIQLGLKGSMVKSYVHDWIVRITDITDEVIKIRESIKSRAFEESMLPVEYKYCFDEL
ncbi:DUF4291 domain-containing protein [Clostridium sp. SHJSY1]|uniref:DUF4291 domain-containing protein n=1 Tax=Clostridium sp. SHJSY1 TaxID=2942483 RepID=UPI0028743527|nr:DUF4291 domain-containing protein [Clostridium sp. SHJSY1]MDS0526748.1 DUF4291 domain-containing protein [Clostridium sp. SHJSY1]